MAEPTNIEIYALLIELKTKFEIAMEKIPEHENRIRDLEKFRWQLPTSMIVSIGSALAATGAIVYDFLHLAHH